MGDDGSPSVLRHNIIELELKLEEEKDRYRDLKSHLKLSKLAASQEIDNQRRVCLMQREVMARLQEDNKTLREREARDQETLKCMLDEMGKKDRDFREKLLEFECGEKRAQCEVLEWKSKYCELEARVSRLIGETVAGFERKEREIQEKISELAEENRNLKIRASMVSEGNCYYDFKGKEINVEENPRDPIEKEKERTSEIDEEDEDEVPLSHLIKKRLADASHSSKEFFASQKPSEPGRNGGKRVPSGGEDVHTPLESAIKQQQESNIVSNSRKTLKLTDLSSSASARNPGSTGFNGVCHLSFFSPQLKRKWVQFWSCAVDRSARPVDRNRARIQDLCLDLARSTARPCNAFLGSVVCHGRPWRSTAYQVRIHIRKAVF